eukprot:3754156-Amphidinium_carterae.1
MRQRQRTGAGMAATSDRCRVRYIERDRGAHDPVRLDGVHRPELTVELPQCHGRIVVDPEGAKRRSSGEVLKELQSNPTDVAVEVVTH